MTAKAAAEDAVTIRQAPPGGHQAIASPTRKEKP